MDKIVDFLMTRVTDPAKVGWTALFLVMFTVAVSVYVFMGIKGVEDVQERNNIEAARIQEVRNFQ